MLCSSQGNTNRIRTKEWLKLGFLRWFSAALQSLSKQGQQQVDQDCVWLDLRLSMDGDFTACLGRLCQCSTILMGKKCFPLFRWGFRFFSSCPCALILPFVGLDPVITSLLHWWPQKQMQHTDVSHQSRTQGSSPLPCWQHSSLWWPESSWSFLLQECTARLKM